MLGCQPANRSKSQVDGRRGVSPLRYMLGSLLRRRARASQSVRKPEKIFGVTMSESCSFFL